MQNTKINQVITTKYMTSFSCIGPDCEANCCRGWAVNFDKKAYKNLKKLYSNNPAERKKFKESFTKNSKSTNMLDYAILQHNEEGVCPYLASDGLCEIHAKFGGNRLGWVCKDYPRSMQNYGGEIELFGALSCPEVARLCLLNEGSCQLVTVPGEIVRNTSKIMDLLSNTGNNFNRFRNEIRSVLMLLAAASQYRVSERIFLMLYFAQRFSLALQTEGNQLSQESFEQEIEHIADPNTHNSLVAAFNSSKEDPMKAFVVVQAVIEFRTDTTSDFNRMIVGCWNNCVGQTPDQQVEQSVENFAQIIDFYKNRKSKLESAYGEQIERYFENYVTDFLYKCDFLKSNSLLHYLRGLLIRLNIIRFMFYTHPNLNPVLSNPDDFSMSEIKALLDSSIVEVTFLTTRAFDHLVPFMVKVINQTLDEYAIDDMESISSLAKL